MHGVPTRAAVAQLAPDQVDLAEPEAAAQVGERLGQRGDGHAGRAGAVRGSLSWAAAGVRRIVMVKLANQPLGSRPRLTASAERRRHVPPWSQDP